MANRFWRAFVIFLSSCGTAAPASTGSLPAPSEADLDAAEEAVYAALLTLRYPASLYVIVDTTTNMNDGTVIGTTIARSAQELSGVAPDTAVSYRSRNQTVQSVRSDMNLGAPYVLLKLTELQQMVTEGSGVASQAGWDTFHAQYAGANGIIDLSRVGFDAALDQAVAYVGYGCNVWCGEGDTYLLNKAGGAWVVVQQTLVWIS